jgi:hypothetical protein
MYVLDNHITDCSGDAFVNPYAATADTPILAIRNRTRDNGEVFGSGFGDWGTVALNHVTTDTGGAETDYVNAGSGDLNLISGAPGVGTSLMPYRNIGALTGAGGGIAEEDVVDVQYVLTGNDNYTGGDAGTLTLPDVGDVRDGTTYGVGGDGSEGEAEEFADWTATERKQIRYRLGVDGDTEEPSVNEPDLGLAFGNVTHWAGVAVADPDVPGVPVVDIGFVGGVVIESVSAVDANLVQINAETTPVDNLEAAFDGTGYGLKLASDGLDSIATTAPTGVASNFREMVVQVWRRFFRRAVRTDTTLKTYADNGTTELTTQTISTTDDTETQGTATSA